MLYTRIAAQLRNSIAALLDQSQPFGRLALVQVFSIAGDAMVTISLAGSLFFSISPNAAKGKIILYLLVTMAPFAIVAPVLGPLVDRSTSARRAIVAISTGGRAFLCLLMASDLHSLALFPEAFSILVLSRLYMVTKSTLVPVLTSDEYTASDRGSISTSGQGLATDRYTASSQDRVDDPSPINKRGEPGYHEGLATRNAQLSLLASLAGTVGTTLAVGILKGVGASWVLRVDILIYASGMVAGLRLPRYIGKIRPRQHQSDTHVYEASHNEASNEDNYRDKWSHESTEQVNAARQSLWMKAFVDPEVLLGLNVMSILRALVGFFVFLIAFGLRREHASMFWYGYVLVASGAGSLIGILLVPRLRKRISEQSLLTAAVWLVMIGAGITASFGNVVAQGILAFTLGLGSSGAQPAFDAIVQRLVPAVQQGRAFARFQTRLQLSWVLGSLISVMVAIPFVSGNIIVAAVAGVTGLFYLAGRYSSGQRANSGGYGGR